MKRYILYMFFLQVLNSCEQKPDAITEDEATRVINKFDEGWQNKNLHTVDSVLAPAYVYFTKSGSTFSRDSVVATAGELSYALTDMSRTEFVVTLYGNTAIVSTRWKAKGSYRGTPFDEDQRCSVVVIKRDDKVEILSEHCTPIRSTFEFH
jgi:ketosteroid isomerase-like protein